MFGYVIPLKPELKIKDFQKYRAYYCGLCKEIHNYSSLSRLSLSYDATFLYIFLSSLANDEENIVEKRCVVNPLSKKRPVCNTIHADYAAAANVLLSWHKFSDAAKDDRNIFYYMLKWLYSGPYKHASLTCPKLSECMAKDLARLAQIEEEKTADLDIPANEFAKVTGNLFSLSPNVDDEKRETLFSFGFNLGRFIYLIDAYDDITKDIKSKSYNPFLLKYKYSNEDIGKFKIRIYEEASFNLYYSLAQAAREYEKLEIIKNNDILDNIIYLGLKNKTISVLEEK